MTAINGLASAVAWTGYTGLYASPGYVNPYRFALSVDGGTFETTAMSGSGVIVQSRLPLPYSWGGSITCRAPNTPASGYSGSVSWGDSQYDTNVREWSLDISWGEKRVTAMDGVGIAAHSYIPLAASWRGTFGGYVDGTTPLTLPNVPGATLAALTLKLLEATTDDTLSGTAIATRMSPEVGIDGTGEFQYSFEGTGQLTAAGTNFGVASSGIFSSGTLITPTAGSLVLTAASGRTYTGNAFPTGFSLRCGVASGIEAVIRFRGTGALTIA